MNCFNEEYIQQVLDGECSPGEKKLFDAHVGECISCFTQFEMQQKRSANIKAKINALYDEEISIPEFKRSRVPEAKSIPLKRKLAYTFAVASVLLCVLLMGINQNETSNDSMVFYSLEYELDANKPISEQDMVMYYTDEEGNTYENGFN